MKPTLPFVAAVAASLLACGPDETSCPAIACNENTTIRIEPAITHAGSYDVTLHVDGAQVSCLVPIPLDRGQPACAAGEGLGVRDVSFWAGNEGGLAEIRIDRIASLVRVEIGLERQVVVDAEVTPAYSEEQLGNLFCFGDPIMCGRATGTVSPK